MGDRPPPTVSEGLNDWRSSRAPRHPVTETEGPSSFQRKGSGLSTPDGQGAANKEEIWTIGSKFKPAPSGPAEDGSGSRFGSLRGKSDMGPPKEPLSEEVDWRVSTRPRPVARNSVSRKSYLFLLKIC